MNNAEHIIAEINGAMHRRKISNGAALTLIMRLAPMLNNPDYDDNSPEVLALQEEVRNFCAKLPRYFVVIPMNHGTYVLADIRPFSTKADALRRAGEIGEREAIVLVEIEELPQWSG